MESGYFITGICTDKLLKLVWRNGITLQLKYIARFLFLFYCSIFTSTFSLLERIFYSKKISSIKCPEDPIFIVGHWRYGTTYLHQLLNKSPDLTAPTLFQSGTPECFLISRRFLIPHIRPFLSKKRSVDNVQVGLDEPQEDEYALFRITSFSPVEKLIFPKNSYFFSNDIYNYMPDDKNEPMWRNAYITFCKKKIFLKQARELYLKIPLIQCVYHTCENYFQKQNLSISIAIH